MVAISRAQTKGSAVVKRDLYYDCDIYGNCYYSPWSEWGRWVALAVTLIALGLLFIGCAIISARRRRAAGRQPFYGTAWVGPKHNEPQPTYVHTGNNGAYAAPAPPYSPPPNGYFRPQDAGTTTTGPNQYEMHGFQPVALNNYQQETGQMQYATPAPPPAAAYPPPAHTTREKY